MSSLKQQKKTKKPKNKKICKKNYTELQKWNICISTKFTHTQMHSNTNKSKVLTNFAVKVIKIINYIFSQPQLHAFSSMQADISLNSKTFSLHDCELVYIWRCVCVRVPLCWLVERKFREEIKQTTFYRKLHLFAAAATAIASPFRR